MGIEDIEPRVVIWFRKMREDDISLQATPVVTHPHSIFDGQRLYTAEQLEQAEQIGMQRIWDLLPESYQKELRSTRDEVIKEHLKFVEPQDSLDEVMEKINSLISEYDFPLSILQDVHQRLNDCTKVGYAKQQLRYLQNIKKSMVRKDEMQKLQHRN